MMQERERAKTRLNIKTILAVFLGAGVVIALLNMALTSGWDKIGGEEPPRQAVAVYVPPGGAYQSAQLNKFEEILPEYEWHVISSCDNLLIQLRRTELGHNGILQRIVVLVLEEEMTFRAMENVMARGVDCGNVVRTDFPNWNNRVVIVVRTETGRIQATDDYHRYVNPFTFPDVLIRNEIRSAAANIPFNEN